MIPDINVSLLLRLPRGAGPLPTIVKTHAAIIEKVGSVWFGVRGRIKEERYLHIWKQLSDSQPTFIFLVQLEKGQTTLFRGVVTEISDHVPSGEQAMVPPYYSENEILKFMRFWMKVSAFSKLNVTQFNRLKLSSSGLPVARIIGRNMCSTMWVDSPSTI